MLLNFHFLELKFRSKKQRMYLISNNQREREEKIWTVGLSEKWERPLEPIGKEAIKTHPH